MGHGSSVACKTWHSTKNLGKYARITSKQPGMSAHYRAANGFFNRPVPLMSAQRESKGQTDEKERGILAGAQQCLGHVGTWLGKYVFKSHLYAL